MGLFAQPSLLHVHKPRTDVERHLHIALSGGIAVELAFHHVTHIVLLGNDIHLVLHAMALHKLAHLHTMALMFEQCAYQTLERIAGRAEVGYGRFELIARS